MEPEKYKNINSAVSQKQTMHKEKLREAQSDIRDLINWVKIFEEEYDLEKDVVATLCSRLEKLSEKLTKIED